MVGPTCVSESKTWKPSRAIAQSPRLGPILPQHLVREVAFLELPLPLGTLAFPSSAWLRIGTILAARHEILPGGGTPRLERLQEVPQRRPRHVVGEGRVPGDRDAEGEMLLVAEITRQL